MYLMAFVFHVFMTLRAINVTEKSSDFSNFLAKVSVRQTQRTINNTRTHIAKKINMIVTMTLTCKNKKKKKNVIKEI